jgi:hypothetical protein
MQDHGQIARAFAAWQGAHQKLSDAQERLAVATQGWQQGLQPRPDGLQAEVLTLKAEQDLRYELAAEALRNRGKAGATVAAQGRPGAAGGSSAQPA